MDVVSVFEVFGLLVILASIAFIFTQLIKFAFKQKENKVRLGAELLLSFVIIYICIPAAHRVTGTTEYLIETSSFVALLWWLSLAFLIDAAIRKYIWYGLKIEHGVCQVPKLVQDVTSFLLYAIVIMIVMHFVYEEPIAAVLATSGGVAFVLGLAAQKTLSEAFAGLSLSMSKTLKVGDYLDINGIYGQVREINWRSISLLSPNTGSMYIFANSEVAHNIVLNYSTPNDNFKTDVTFSVELHAPPELVMRSVMDELKNSRFVLQDPKPDIHALEFNQLGINYRIRFFFNGDDPWWDAQNEVVNAIWLAMKRNGFRFAVNRNFLQSGIEWEHDSQPNKPQSTASELIELLSKQKLFSNMDEAKLSSLASKMERIEWLPPECIYQQNGKSDYLYLITEGTSSVYRSDDESEYFLSDLTEGSLCGIPYLSEDGLLYYSHTLQAKQFCVGYKVGIANLSELVGKEELIARFNKIFLAKDREQSLLLTQAKQKLNNELSARNQVMFMQALKSHMSNYYRSGFLNHVYDSVFAHHHHTKILDALAGTCALIAVEDGEISASEEEHFCAIIEHINSLKHIDHNQVKGQFDKYASSALADFEQTKERVFKLLSDCNHDEHSNHIIMATCHAIAGVHGVHTERGQQLIKELAEILGSTEDAIEVSKILGEGLTSKEGPDQDS